MNTSPDAQPPRRGWFSRLFGRKPAEPAFPSSTPNDSMTRPQPPLADARQTEPTATAIPPPNAPDAHEHTHAAAELSAATEVMEPAATAPEPAEAAAAASMTAGSAAHPEVTDDAPSVPAHETEPPAGHGLMTLSAFIAPPHDAPSSSETAHTAPQEIGSVEADAGEGASEAGVVAEHGSEQVASAVIATEETSLTVDPVASAEAPRSKEAREPETSFEPAAEAVAQPQEQDAGVAREISPEEEATLLRVRGLTNQGRHEEAARLCQSAFGARPLVRDKQGHPVYFKEMLRIELRRGDPEALQAIMEQFRQNVPPRDPVVDIMSARHFTDAGKWDEAREAWQRVLAMYPNRRVALDGIEEVNAKSAAQAV